MYFLGRKKKLLASSLLWASSIALVFLKNIGLVNFLLARWSNKVIIIVSHKSPEHDSPGNCDTVIFLTGHFMPDV